MFLLTCVAVSFKQAAAILALAEAQRGGDADNPIAWRFADSEARTKGDASVTAAPNRPEGWPSDQDQEWQKSLLYKDSENLPKAPEGYKDGPMPILSDSVFSLIILVYVSVIFIFMFFAFCWREPEPPPPDPAHKNIPMITSILDEMEKQQAMEDSGQGDDRDGLEPTPSEGDSHEMANHPLIDVSDASDLPSTNNPGLLQLPLVGVSVHQETANS